MQNLVISIFQCFFTSAKISLSKRRTENSANSIHFGVFLVFFIIIHMAASRPTLAH